MRNDVKSHVELTTLRFFINLYFQTPNKKLCIFIKILRFAILNAKLQRFLLNNIFLHIYYQDEHEFEASFLV